MAKPAGAPKSGGRKPGTPNKRTAETIAKVEASGVTPLEYMLSVMRKEIDPSMEPAQQWSAIGMKFEAAKAAAPYVHAKLSSIDATVEHTGDLFDDLLKSVNGTALKVVPDDDEG